MYNILIYNSFSINSLVTGVHWKSRLAFMNCCQLQCKLGVSELGI